MGARRGLLARRHGRIETRDRKGLERPLRYCAYPIFASERLASAPKGERVVYSLQKPLPGGQTVLSLTPMEFRDAAGHAHPPTAPAPSPLSWGPPPNAPLRAPVTARAGLPMDAREREVSRHVPVKRDEEKRLRSPSAYLWAMLLARIYEVFPLLCPRCVEPIEVIVLARPAPDYQFDQTLS